MLCVVLVNSSYVSRSIWDKNTIIHNLHYRRRPYNFKIHLFYVLTSGITAPDSYVLFSNIFLMNSIFLSIYLIVVRDSSILLYFEVVYVKNE